MSAIPSYYRNHGRSRFLGFDMLQSRYAVPAWSYLFEKYPPARIIEIGTWSGGFTCCLAIAAKNAGADVWTLDINRECEDVASWFALLGVHFRQVDSQGDAGQILLADLVRTAKGTVWLLCDGGSKVAEFNRYAPILRHGDVIAAHDYYTGDGWPWQEIKDEQTADVRRDNRLTPFFPSIFRNTGWGVWRKCAKGEPNMIQPATLDLLRGLERLDGWCTREKAEAMAAMLLANHIPPHPLVVEIGVFGGRSLIAQALALKEKGSGIIYGIDPWTVTAALEGEHNQASADWWSKLDMASIHAACMRTIGQYDLWPFVRILAAPAQHVAGTFAEESIDVLHLDGNHAELASCRDVELYLPKLKRGGWWWADDISWETNNKAIGMLDADCERVLDVGDCRLYRKP